jgi:hypothetical protein
MARKMLKDDGDVPMPDANRYDYNLFVIGAGSGGVRGSRTAASELRSHYSSFIYYRPSPLPCPPLTPTPMAAGRPFMEENSLGQETKTPVFIHSDSHYDKNR